MKHRSRIKKELFENVNFSETANLNLEPDTLIKLKMDYSTAVLGNLSKIIEEI